MSLNYRKATRMLLIIIFTFSPSQLLAEQSSANNWWDNFSLKPGLGFRHLGVDVTRKSDGYHGIISNADFAQLAFSLNIVFNEFQLDDEGKVFLELNL